MDFEVQRFTRRCAATDRELAPGELFYSVLLAEGAEVVRRDYAAEAWSGPPADALGWWKSQLPSADARPKKPQWAPNDVMLGLFDELAERPEQADLRYVLALLLLRRRVLRLEETEAEGTEQETMLVYCPRRETEYRVAVSMPDPARTAEIQAELARLLVVEPVGSEPSAGEASVAA